MREIKFRAWDKKENKFWYNVQHHQSFTDLNGKSDYAGFHRFIEDDRFVLMQYTGLKDKNGVEIYEGDIVQYYKNRGVDTEKALMLVEYKGCMFTLPFEPQVYGNVHEHPELQEGSQC